MAGEIKDLAEQAISQARSSMIAAADALSSGDFAGFKTQLASFSQLPAVQQIATLVSTSGKAIDDFVEWIRASGPFGQLIVDLTMTGFGGMLWRYGGQIAFALGAVELTELIVIIGFVLMVIGVIGAVGNAHKIIGQLKAFDLNQLATGS